MLSAIRHYFEVISAFLPLLGIAAFFVGFGWIIHRMPDDREPK